MNKKETYIARRRALRRRQIFEGAANVFAEKGYHSATVREVAEAAGLAKGTVYEYVKTKEDMLLLVMEEGLAMIFEEVEKSLKKDDNPINSVKTLLNVMMKMLDKYKKVSKVVTHEMKGLSGDVLVKLLELKRRYLKVVENILREGVSEKKFKPMDTLLCAEILGHLCVFWVDYGDLPFEKSSFRKVTDTITTIFLEGILLNDGDRAGEKKAGRIKFERG
ncbi:MAG: TetR/AcrR family transcriptional regulator [bacterium]